MTTKKAAPIGLFHTPKTLKELEDWVVAHKDPHVTTAFGMTWNFMATHFDCVEKEEK